MEVVVNVHAGRTTTSEQSQLGVLTCSKRKLTTSETETAAQASKKLLWQTYQSQQQLQTVTPTRDDDETCSASQLHHAHKQSTFARSTTTVQANAW